MFNKSDNKLNIIFNLLIFFTIFFNCPTIKADEALIYVRANLSERYIHYNEVITKYGEIWIGYTKEKNSITTEGGRERFIIGKAYYFYKKGEINNEKNMGMNQTDKN